jgi:hypothetical protein
MRLRSIIWVGIAFILSTAGLYAETVVTLPAGASENFTVQSLQSNTLLRADASAVLTGTNVALGTQGSTMTLQAGSTGASGFVGGFFCVIPVGGSRRVAA